MGQAGFLLSLGGKTAAIDLYLSDYLAEKYRGKLFPHTRMAPPPITPDKLTGIDYYFCTHRHSDHMDPGTFPVVMRNNPNCIGIVPEAFLQRAVDMGVPGNRILAIDAGASATLPGSELTVEAIQSAHEEPDTDDRGKALYLGYVIRSPECGVYHSGDCVPYDGLTAAIKKAAPDIALLPVNGRDEYRQSNNVPGNFTVQEAIKTADDARIPILIPHHFGMFDFNTVSVKTIQKAAARHNREGVQIIIPELGKTLSFNRTN